MHFPVDMILQKLGGLLQKCSKTKDFSNGLPLHSIIVKMGFIHDLFICNHLINFYAKCTNVKSAHKIFNLIPEPNLVSWSVLITGYDQARKHSMAIDLFARMKLKPNEFIYAGVLSSCGSLLAISQGKQIHAHALKTGCTSISFVSNSLMSMYMKCGCFDNAFLIFTNLKEPSSISYNAMIAGFAENSQFDKGLELSKLMKQFGLETDQFSYVSALGICTEKKDFETGETLHCETIKLGLDITSFVGNVILTMYSKCGLITEVEKAFDSIKEKDVISCNTYIGACSHCGDHAKSLRLYKDMKILFGLSPDDFTLTSALSACAELACIRYDAQIHAQLIRTKFAFDIGVGNAIIDMYAKCGPIGYAKRSFHRLSERNLVSWNTMLIALGHHGYGKIAIGLSEQMIDEKIVPDAVTFIGLLTACSHSGLVNEGLTYFNSMTENYKISLKIEHLSCLIDVLGRAGRLGKPTIT